MKDIPLLDVRLNYRTSEVLCNQSRTFSDGKISQEEKLSSNKIESKVITYIVEQLIWG